MSAEGVVLSEWERSTEGMLVSEARRHVNGCAHMLRGSALRLKNLLGNYYGMLMSAEDYKITVRERMELTAVVDLLTDYLSYAEGNEGEDVWRIKETK